MLSHQILAQLRESYWRASLCPVNNGMIYLLRRGTAFSFTLIELKCVDSKTKHVIVRDQVDFRKNQVEVAFQVPKYQSLIEKTCPKMMFDFRSHYFDLVTTPDRN